MSKSIKFYILLFGRLDSYIFFLNIANVGYGQGHFFKIRNEIFVHLVFPSIDLVQIDRLDHSLCSFWKHLAIVKCKAENKIIYLKINTNKTIFFVSFIAISTHRYIPGSCNLMINSVCSLQTSKEFVQRWDVFLFNNWWPESYYLHI